MKDNLIKWLIALLLDKLKFDNPKVLLIVATIAVGIQAMILFALTNNVITENDTWRFLLQALAVLIPAGTALVGTRTTRYIKAAKRQHHRADLLNQITASAELRPFSFATRPMNALGVDRIKSILAVFVGVTLAVRDLVEDFRDTNLLDKGRSIIEIFFLIQRSFADLLMAKAAWEELKDMDAVEAVAIENHLKNLYSDEDEALEDLVEEGFELIPHFHTAGIEVAEGVTASMALVRNVGTYADKWKARKAA